MNMTYLTTAAAAHFDVTLRGQGAQRRTNEMQAIDRAHRIGQERKVFAYRLIARDTVEETVLRLQSTKRNLADAIITADNNLIRDLWGTKIWNCCCLNDKTLGDDTRSEIAPKWGAFVTNRLGSFQRNVRTGWLSLVCDQR